LGDRERGRVRKPVRRTDHERVERVLRIQRPARVGALFLALRCGRSALRLLADVELDRALLPGDVALRSCDQATEMAFDPVAREVVRDAADELGDRDLRASDALEARAARGLSARA